MPSFELDWELGVFKALRGLWRAVRPVTAPAFDPEVAATFAGSADRWRWFAGVIAGAPIRVEVARDHGGIRGDTVLLPAFVELTPDAELNRAVYLLRVAVDATIARHAPAVPADPVDRFIAELVAAAHALRTLHTELPAFGQAWADAAALVRTTRPTELGPRAMVEEAARCAVLSGESPPSDLIDKLRAAPAGGLPSPPVPLWGALIAVDDAGHGELDDEAKLPPASDASEEEVGALDAIEVLRLDEEEDDIHELPIHAFEKVELAEAFTGTLRQLDGEDDLEDHLESLEEVNLGTLIRGGPQAHSVLRADITLDASVPDVANIGADETGVVYDEWDGRQWLRGWCTVYPADVPEGGDPARAREALHRHRRDVESLHSALLAHRTQRRLQRRQLDGDGFDLDAVVDAQAALAAGRTPSPRLYETRRKDRRDVATTVLLDISLSSDSWIAGQRVLDVSREALLVLGEVAERLGDRLQILAFASSTRHKVRVWRVRGWDTSWAVGQRALHRLAPQGYTRLGAAIRHATWELDQVSARSRVLLLITDGKPTDWDRYEGRHGVADVRKALEQARRDGVVAHALAVDAVARDYLPQMLGPGGWSILRRPADLPDALTRVYGRLG
ncbi:MAG: nitric oxide reductase activation protein [Myxococcota bacterium]|jgi:nitric oxide reductase activation protein